MRTTVVIQDGYLNQLGFVWICQQGAALTLGRRATLLSGVATKEAISRASTRRISWNNLRRTDGRRTSEQARGPFLCAPTMITAIATHHKMLDAQLKKRVPTKRGHECSNVMGEVSDYMEVSWANFFGEMRLGTWISWGAGPPLAEASARFSRHDAQITEGQGEILDWEGEGGHLEEPQPPPSITPYMCSSHQWTCQRKGPRTYDFFFRGWGLY